MESSPMLHCLSPQTPAVGLGTVTSLVWQPKQHLEAVKLSSIKGYISVLLSNSVSQGMKTEAIRHETIYCGLKFKKFSCVNLSWYKEENAVRVSHQLTVSLFNRIMQPDLKFGLLQTALTTSVLLVSSQVEMTKHIFKMLRCLQWTVKLM